MPAAYYRLQLCQCLNILASAHGQHKRTQAACIRQSIITALGQLEQGCPAHNKQHRNAPQGSKALA